MQEIIFRGKGIQSDRWYEGFYAYYGGKSFILEIVDFDITKWHEVKSRTVGQFSGCYDKNGKRIFDGDMLATPDENHKAIVEFHGGQFGIALYDIVGEYKGFYWSHDAMTVTQFEAIGFCSEYEEIIGNIHDEDF